MTGRVPASFNGSLVTPIFKRGDKLDPSNYRPIGVTEPIMRLYANILNARILAFTEDAGLRVDTQAGFRPGLSTVHQLFTLQHLIDSQSPLYACFLDLKGAYDRVNRHILWEVLRRLGVAGRMLAAIQSLYANYTVAIKVGGNVSPALPSVTGLKQGCPLSPTLFGLFSDGNHRQLVDKCPMGGPRLRCGRIVHDLGYADDFVLLATTPAGLQCSIDAVSDFCQHTGMIISVEKTKIVVFSQSLVGPFQWLCSGTPLEWVQQVTYLGIVFDAAVGMALTFGKLHRNMLGAWARLRRQYGKLQCVLSVGLLLRLYDACVPPTASYGCEVWGLRPLPTGAPRMARDSLASSHLKLLRGIARVPTSVHTAILLAELEQRPLHHAWWRRMACFWNGLAAQPAGNLYKQVAQDNLWDAITHNTKNWAWAFIRGLRDMGYDFPIRFDVLVPVDFPAILQLLDGPSTSVWQSVDICPRTCPTSGATLCTYARWFAQPPLGPRRPRSILQLPLSARRMRSFLRFRMGCHTLQNVSGRRSGVPRPQRHCTHCAMHTLGDERHLIFECPAVQPIRAKYPSLFGTTIVTMQQFMWQGDLLRVAHFVVDCFDFLRDGGGGQ